MLWPALKQYPSGALQIVRHTASRAEYVCYGRRPGVDELIGKRDLDRFAGQKSPAFNLGIQGAIQINDEIGEGTGNGAIRHYRGVTDFADDTGCGGSLRYEA
jgi:hypothetical protein